MRLERALFGIFSFCWLLSILAAFDAPALAGRVPLGLYHLYGLAAFGGWISGNVYVWRANRWPASRRRLLPIYLVGPPGLLYLLHAMAPQPIRDTAPLAPIYAFGVFAILFLVPVTLRRR